ncbi:MAG: IS3 family transposase, partial [Pseudomonadales bacterium]|nr:IS3 family transposase [Pseudomonadales bacterium]
VYTTGEAFFNSIKAGLLHQRTFSDATHAVAYIIKYIKLYNRACLDTALSYQSPQYYGKLSAYAFYGVSYDFGVEVDRTFQVPLGYNFLIKS